MKYIHLKDYAVIVQAYEWEKSIPSDPIYQGFRDLAGTVYNFFEQIFNYWVCPIAITNDFTECSNRIIRENNVKGRGNSFEILRGRTLFRKTNIDRAKEGGVLLGPAVRKKGAIFHFEEVKGLDNSLNDSGNFSTEDDFNSFDYDPLIGLVAGRDYDPETGEFFDDVFDDDDDADSWCHVRRSSSGCLFRWQSHTT